MVYRETFLQIHKLPIQFLIHSYAPLRELRVGDTFQDRRQLGHQDAARGGTSIDQQSQSSQEVP